MKLTALSIISLAALSAPPALAETWVTAVTFPFSSSNPRPVAYQIDVQSIYRRSDWTYARGRISGTTETITANCRKNLLQLGSDGVNPSWIERKGDAWFNYYPKGHHMRFAHGRPIDVGGQTVMSYWMSGVFDFLCTR